MKTILKNLNDSTKYQYMGDWLIDKYNDEDLKSEIHARANQDLLNLLSRKVSLTDADSFLYLSLVYIAMECYDSNFYIHLPNYYHEAYDSFSAQTVDNKIREYIKYIRRIGDDDNNRIINYVLKDAFVPKTYLSKFYRFLYDIFVIDYDYNFPQEINDTDIIIEINKEIRDLLTQIITRELKFTGDEIKIKVNDTYKNYVLTKGTVLALSSKESLHNLTPIIIKMLNAFHADFWQDDIKEVTLNKYLLEGFEEWKKDNINRSNQTGDRKTFTKEILKPQITCYDQLNKGIILSTRRHIVNGAQANDSFEIKIFNGDNLISSIGYDKLILKRSMGGIRIEPMNIVVKQFLGQLSYCVLHNNHKVYSTQSNLYYDHLIFDKDLKLLKNVKNYNDNALIISNNKMSNSEFTEDIEANYHYYKGVLTENSVLNFERNKVLLTQNFLMKVMGNPSDSLIANYNGKQIDVFTTLFDLYIDIDDENVDSLILAVNSTNYKLSDIASSLQSNGRNYFALNLNAVITEAGYYIIHLVNPRVNKAQIQFIYDPMQINRFELNDDYSINHHISSSFFSTENIHHTKEQLEINEIQYLQKETILQGRTLKYSLKIVVDNYEINGKSFYFSRYIWFPNLRTDLVINTSGIVEYEIFSNDFIITKKILQEPNNKLTIKHNDLEFSLADSIDGKIWVIIKKKNGKVIRLLVHKYNIYSNKNCIIIPEVNSVKFKINFVGLNKMSLQYKNESGKDEKLTLNDGVFVKVPLVPNIEYLLKVVEGDDTNIFSINNQVRVHQEIYHSYLGVDRLMKNDYSVDGAIIDEDSKTEQLRGVVLNGLHYDEESNINGILSYHSRDNDTLYEFENINPVKIEFIGDVTVSSSTEVIPVVAYITDSDFDGLMLDKYGCTIDLSENQRHGPINYFKMTIRGELK